jgi:hypothetical protein
MIDVECMEPYYIEEYQDRDCIETQQRRIFFWLLLNIYMRAKFEVVAKTRSYMDHTTLGTVNLEPQMLLDVEREHIF